jgi:hypothetical protein
MDVIDLRICIEWSALLFIFCTQLLCCKNIKSACCDMELKQLITQKIRKVGPLNFCAKCVF